MDAPEGGKGEKAVALARASLTVAQRAALEYSHATSEMKRLQSIDRLQAVLSKARLASDNVHIASIVAAVKALGRIDVLTALPA